MNIIRDIQKSDFNEWVVLWDAYNKFYGRAGETALPIEITQKTWERFFDDKEPVYAVVAECDKKLIGIAHFIFHRSTTLIENTCYLQDLFVSESNRGKNSGKFLIESVCEKAKKAGATRVYWHTHQSNQNAMYLYDKIADKTGFMLYRKLISK